MTPAYENISVLPYFFNLLPISPSSGQGPVNFMHTKRPRTGFKAEVIALGVLCMRRVRTRESANLVRACDTTLNPRSAKVEGGGNAEGALVIGVTYEDYLVDDPP